MQYVRKKQEKGTVFKHGGGNMSSGQEGSAFLVTGCVGFIGFHMANRLLAEGNEVFGIDNLNDYYDVRLKRDRLAILQRNPRFSFFKGSVENKELLEHVFSLRPFETVIHLAAQAGVRYSLEQPQQYVQANVAGFLNILECCRKRQTKHLIYASSSSVYGNNRNTPFAETDCTEKPVSMYAVSKKANELMAYAYCHLYKLPATGLRFFTVYGPWGRPDMAVFKFTGDILKGEPIKVYNQGNMKRDFTYIDDVIESISRLIKKGPPAGTIPYKIYNVGNHKPVELNDLIACLEKELGRKAKKIFLPLQPGDVLETFASVQELEQAINYRPSVSIEEGIKRFAAWYKSYYKIS